MDSYFTKTPTEPTPVVGDEIVVGDTTGQDTAKADALKRAEEEYRSHPTGLRRKELQKIIRELKSEVVLNR